MKKKIIKIIVSFILICILRYYGLYIAIDIDNTLLLNIMSKYNIMINLRPILELPIITLIFEHNETPLVYAISMNKYNSVKVLLNNGADPNAAYGWKENLGKPLKYCVRLGGPNRYKIAKLLLDYGAKGFESKTLLIDILSHSNLDDNEYTLNEKKMLFLEWMSKNYIYDNAFNYEIVYWAVEGNAVDEFLYMINNYTIDLNYKNDKSQYILIPAARNRNVELFKLLINYGANVDFVTKDGLTIENFITDERYDKQFINGKYETINYDSEKAEMLRIVNDVSEKNNLSKSNN